MHYQCRFYTFQRFMFDYFPAIGVLILQYLLQFSVKIDKWEISVEWVPAKVTIIMIPLRHHFCKSRYESSIYSCLSFLFSVKFDKGVLVGTIFGITGGSQAICSSVTLRFFLQSEHLSESGALFEIDALDEVDTFWLMYCFSICQKVLHS